MQFGKTNTCFTRSKSIGLNDFLIRSNALNIWISDCHVTKSRSLTTPILHEYINKWQSYLITTPNETNFIYSSLKPQNGKQKNSFCSSVLELKVRTIVTSWVIKFFTVTIIVTMNCMNCVRTLVIILNRQLFTK